MSKLKQATLSSLKGVVVVEDFLRHKNVLESEDETEDVILKSLSYLKMKKPAKEVLSSTGIGVVVKALENHTSEKISNEAKNLSKLWVLDGECKRQPTVKVRYDNLTRHIRRTSVKFFLKELGENEKNEKIADILEREIFNQSNRLISKSYKKTVRKIIFVLRHDAAENAALKNGKVTPVSFAIKYRR
ncbi:transcription elongation factor A N-terminal and central domain-containing protein 2-like isoform X1 [Stegodyphus dumicola]|uniref:transcription elongation factor A N-terminal and central domain-containing protein 2-like isoform X1 n=1 Tax=Stegodyphus dumicola TaxID=202533 RepID=UPI0015AC3845|nr:transcription elongation factor A N-terminal and central domain-containing protein 2-like isoform X1 [Stegodyphus dumicola]